MSRIQIVEVGPRDGLQNEKIHLDYKTRVQFVKKLAKAGVKRIEVGAFVSPRWVPQMIDSDKVVKSLLKSQANKKLSPSLQFSALVPNEMGMKLALKSGVKEVAIFGAASEKFSKKNINCTINESLQRFESVMALAKANKIKVRGYLSTVFGCPYQGKVQEAQVIKLIEKYFELGIYELSLGDTIGVATPKQVRSLLSKIKNKPYYNKIAMHFHDTRGTALANALASLDLGITILDSSVGGLGGCPYAEGASGNVATEDLVYMLHGMGLKTGIDLKELIKTKNWVEDKVQRNLPSRVGLAGTSFLSH